MGEENVSVFSWTNLLEKGLFLRSEHRLQVNSMAQ